MTGIFPLEQTERLLPERLLQAIILSAFGEDGGTSEGNFEPCIKFL